MADARVETSQYNGNDLGRILPFRRADGSAERMEMKQISGVDTWLSSPQRR